MRRWLPAVFLGLVVLGGARAARAEAVDSKAIDPKATEQLKRMSDFLARQDTFTVRSVAATEVVTKDGQKLEFGNASKTMVDRPNMLRSDRVGDKPASLYYDGSKLSLYSKTENFYATVSAPAAIDEAIDFARNQLGVEAPGADLLYSRPYEIMMEDVVGATYLGKTIVNGVPSHHLAFKGGQSDWQIWIADGPQPVPQKLVIVSKNVQGAPEFRVEMSEWNFSPNLEASAFRFTPPPDSRRIEFERPGTASK